MSRAEDISDYTCYYSISSELNKRDKSIMNLLSEVHNGNIDRVRKIIEESGLPADKQWSDYIVLRYALWRGQRDVAKLLIESGCRINKIKSSSNTPLHIAVKQGDVEIVNILLAKGASVESLNHNGYTPLHFAAQTKSDTMIDLILEKVSVMVSGSSINRGGLMPLHIACMRSNSSDVQRILKFGAVIDEPVVLTSPFWPSYTPLHFAVEYGRTEIVELLLSYRADICAKNINGLTPLHLAVQIKNPDIIDHILAAHSEIKSNVNPQDNSGFSHFHAACMRNNPNAVEGFLRRGVNINSYVGKDHKEWSGYTPLHFAVENECLEIVELLLNYGADISIKNEKGLTPLHFAIHKENKNTVDLILSTHSTWLKNINPIDDRGFSHFHAACMRNDPNIVEVFIRNGVEINSEIDSDSPNWPCYTPLHFAVENNCGETVQLLVQHGADISATEARGLTPLHLAALQPNSKIISLLLRNRLNVNAKTKSGMTPLHMAVEKGHYDHVAVLLDHSADVNSAESSKFSTPLHLATLHKHFAIIDLLLSRGADIYARERDGKIALHTMALRDTKRELDMDLVESYRKIISSLQNFGCDVDYQDSYGRTPLHMACLYRNLAGAYALLDAGANINVEDSIGKTPLLYCMHVFHNIYYIFQDHIEKLRIINFKVSDKNELCYHKLRGSYKRYKRKWKDVEHDDEFEGRCTDELNKMKTVRVDNYSSLYDLIFKDDNEMALHVMNKTLRDMIFANDFLKTFSLYGYLIRLQFKKGEARKVYMKPAKESLESLIGRGLPDACSETVLKYLTNDHLKDLINSRV